MNVLFLSKFFGRLSCLIKSKEYTRHVQNIKIILVGIALSIFLSVLILKNYLFSPGFIPNPECIGGFPFFSERVRYLWDPLFQSGNRIEVTLRYLLFSFLGPRTSHFLVLALMGTITFFVTTKFVKGAISGWKQYLVGSLATIFYMTNPIMANEAFRISFVWGMTWMPLLFYMAFTYLKEVSIYPVREIVKKSICLAIVCSLIVDPFWVIASIGLLIFCFLANLQNPLKRYLSNSFKIATLVFIFFCLFSFWWIFPYLKQSLAGISLPVPYVVTWESTQMLSQNADILNVLRLMWYWIPLPQFIFQSPVSTIYDVATITIPMIMFSSFLLKKDRRTISIGILTIFLLTLSTGLHYFDFFGKLYGWLLFNFPAWFPRTSGRWMMLVTLCYMLLLSILSAESLRRISRINRSARFKKIASVLFFIVLLTPITIVGLPLTLNAPMTPRPIPNDYDATNQWLEGSEGNFKVLAMPEKPFWGFPKPTISWPWLIEMIKENRTSRLSKFIEFQNVRYVLVDGNKLDEQRLGELISAFKSQENLKFHKKIGNIYVFRNQGYRKQLGIPKQLVLVQGDLGKTTSLNMLDSFNPKISSLLFLHQDLKNEKLLPYIDILLLGTEAILDITMFNESFFIRPFITTHHHNPSEFWSKAGTNDPLHGPWHPYLEQRGIENWDFDYGRGLVLTWAPFILEEPSSLKDGDLISRFDFEDENLGNWSVNAENIQTLFLSEDAYEGAYSLKVELYNSTWRWKKINSPLIRANYGDQYKWQFYAKAENVDRMHAKIIEYNENETVITVQRVATIGSGDFNWKKVSFNFAPTSAETAYMQLQVWHGHETTQPLLNKIWIDNVKVYDLKDYLKPNTLEMAFTTQTTGTYDLYIRYFQNKDGGKIALYLDGTQIEIIDTKDQINRFTWKKIGTYNLDRGKHTLTLENREGFNAVNLFALIPQEEVAELEETVESLIQNKRIIYILEAESDMYRENSSVSNKYGGEASNGEVLELTLLSRVWNELEILKPGNYTIVIRSKGNLDVKIDEKEYTANTTQLDWTYLGPVSLDKGKHEIFVYGYQPSDLDVVWLYSTQKENETLEDIFTPKENPAEIISYQKIDPTKYIVEVSATKPFMFAFAEAYDPLWIAHVNGKRIESIPLYSVINGFWINQTGQLEITIEYEPQKWFYYGSAISITTLLGSVAYLVWDWKKKSYDGSTLQRSISWLRKRLRDACTGSKT